MGGTHYRRFTCYLLAPLSLLSCMPGSLASRSAEKAARSPSLTDVKGILVGHYTLKERPTGCTVITSNSPFAAGVDVRGGAPGTRETDLLKAESTVDRINAILLSGGSAFGLDAASGVVKYMEEQGRGFNTQVAKVPIVCGAILFDLRLGDSRIRPDSRAGYEAARTASDAPVTEGNVGVGAGATVGKLLGHERAMKAGVGSWSLQRPDGLTVGAIVALNCVGDVMDGSGRIIAGARRNGGGFVNAIEQLRKGYDAGTPFHENTVLAVVGTNADLTKAQCNKVAQMAQDGLARRINPSHTPWDGDTIFAIATGELKAGAKPVDVGLVGALAADVLATAIERAVEKADSWGAYPSAKDHAAGKR